MGAPAAIRPGPAGQRPPRMPSNSRVSAARSGASSQRRLDPLERQLPHVLGVPRIGARDAPVLAPEVEVLHRRVVRVDRHPQPGSRISLQRVVGERPEPVRDDDVAGRATVSGICSPANRRTSPGPRRSATPWSIRSAPRPSRATRCCRHRTPTASPRGRSVGTRGVAAA